MRALVTGITGFAGANLVPLLLAQGWNVVGTHSRIRPPSPAMLHTGLQTRVHDFNDADAFDAVLREAAPDIVFHLAGQTGAPFPTLLQSHAGATATLLDAVRRVAAHARVIIPGSSAQFGNNQAPRIVEDAPYRPATLYGIAKVAEANVATYFHEVFGLDVIRTHTFNCFGPGQRSAFVPAAFASQIAAIERGAAPPVLRVGNLDAHRDMTDIRDVARAYLCLADQGKSGAVYNVCSGRTVLIRDLVETLRSLSRMPFEVRQDPVRVQAVDVPVQCGDPTLIATETGWAPQIPLGQTMTDVLEEWRRIG